MKRIEDRNGPGPALLAALAAIPGPRPGLDPGSRSGTGAPVAGEVRGQARDGAAPCRGLRPSGIGRLPRALAFTLTLLPTLAAAQILPTGAPAADILLTRALAEQRVFLTCSALDPASHGLIVEGWRRDVAAALAILTENGAPAEAIAAFSAAASFEALLPAPGTPWEEVKQMCDANADWPERYARLDFTILEMTLPAAFP